jgi:hypothetical protein
MVLSQYILLNCLLPSREFFAKSLVSRGEALLFKKEFSRKDDPIFCSCFVKPNESSIAQMKIGINKILNPRSRVFLRSE